MAEFLSKVNKYDGETEHAVKHVDLPSSYREVRRAADLRPAEKFDDIANYRWPRGSAAARSVSGHGGRVELSFVTATRRWCSE